MSPNAAKDLPIVIVTDESHRAQTRTPVFHVMPQLCLRNQVRPLEMERRWENFLENNTASCYSFPSQDQHLPQLVLTASAQENICPPAKPPSSSPSTPRFGKRWGFFASKKSKAENATTVGDSDEALRQKGDIKKKSAPRVLKKPAKFKSTPNLNALRLQDLGNFNVHSPRAAPQLPPSLPVTLCRPETQPLVTMPQRDGPSDSAIYFTMDPDWDESQGEVTLFFIPPPQESGSTWRRGSSVSCVDGSNASPNDVSRMSRKRTQTYGGATDMKSKFAKPIDVLDDSFLDLF